MRIAKEMTMQERQVLAGEQRVLRWGGLAGVLGSELYTTVCPDLADPIR